MEAGPLARQITLFAKQREAAREDGTLEPMTPAEELAVTRSTAHLLWSLWTLLKEAQTERPTSFGSQRYGPFGSITGALHDASERAHRHRDMLSDTRDRAG